MTIIFIWLIFNVVEAICGNGEFNPETEECDGADHCTSDCLCEENYVSVPDENKCIPMCSIKGCDGECASPNECTSCHQEGYDEDCYVCKDGYFSNGYLNCKPLAGNTIFSCASKVASAVIDIKEDFTEHVEVIDTNEWYLTSSICSPVSLINAPYIYGKWFKLNMNFSGYISIETVFHYTRYNITYIKLNQVNVGIETVLTLQTTCPGENSFVSECFYSNDNVDDYILSSRIIAPATSTYYLLVHSQEDSLQATFNLYIRRIHHPCSYVNQEISWNSISRDGYHYIINSNYGVFSDTACSKPSLSGMWFHLYGADRSLIMSTCNTIGDYNTAIHVVSAPIKHDENLSCSYKEDTTKCEAYSYQGCTDFVEDKKVVNSKATLLLSLSSKKDYFIFVSYQTSSFAMINFSVSIACPFGCNGHGRCTENGCLCDEGYVNSGDTCSTCGNGKLDDEEQCDLSVSGSEDKNCDREMCMCHYLNIPMTINGTTKCAPITCYNGVIDIYEECDGGEGCSFCRCMDNYVGHYIPELGCLSKNCGNHRLDEGEECDGGTGCYECKCENGWYNVDKLYCSKMPKWSIYPLAFIPGVVLYLLVWVILFIIFLRKHIRLTKMIEIEQSNLEHIIPFLEKSIIKFDKTHSRFIDITVENPFFSFLSPNIEFGKEVPLDIPEKTTISLTNKRKETLKFTFHACETLRYDIMFKPVTGTVKSGQTVLITAIIIIKCTTVLTEKVPVTLSFPRLKDEVALKYQTEQVSQNSSSDEGHRKSKLGIKKFHVYLNLNVESELSTRIDYNSLNILFPPIGRGTFGNVYKATWRNTDVAVKVMKTDSVYFDELKKNFTKELEIMEQTQYAYIVQFIGSAETENSLCLIMEYFPLGSIRKFYTEHEINDLLKIRMCDNIAQAMDYLHNKQIIHHDLKPDNVLVASSNPNEVVVCKVSDFGTSQAYINTNSHIEKNIGTPMYMAPEVHKTGIASFKSDVFSYAICILEIWICESVYPEDEFHESSDILNFVCSGNRPKIPDNCFYKSIIEECWKVNPDERPNFKQIYHKIQHVLKYYNRLKTKNNPQQVNHITSNFSHDIISFTPSNNKVNRNLSLNERSVLITSQQNENKITDNPINLTSTKESSSSNSSLLNGIGDIQLSFINKEKSSDFSSGPMEDEINSTDSQISESQQSNAFHS
ncbi:hypothetical protein ENUP19_0224G0040 [Entamoeba nuttalli]|uniref:Protein kinase domain containing protein n=2 Tax=Entamoeba nuttalli TaxID=412467 RepID=K2HEU8_ENTNP|nr:protein kinase domain containing protein [Entamoeba nuttalli P19]EKE41319.1 protein kinase domain containing protein [Entamoeba nuttalli P19]|eukprot:XP_008856344.1 protein kinase domain containing protein [Entamoeba nuttalli P19]